MVCGCVLMPLFVDYLPFMTQVESRPKLVLAEQIIAD